MHNSRQQRASRSRFWILNVSCAGVICALWASALTWGVFPYLQSAKEARAQAAENYHLQHSLVSLRKQEGELRQEVEDLVGVLSKRYDVDCPAGETLLDTFTRLIAKHHLEMVSFVEHTHGERPSNGQSIDVRLQGSYTDVCAWLDALARLTEPVRVVTLQLSPYGQKGDQCQARAELTFYELPLKLAQRGK